MVAIKKEGNPKSRKKFPFSSNRQSARQRARYSSLLKSLSHHFPFPRCISTGLLLPFFPSKVNHSSFAFSSYISFHLSTTFYIAYVVLKDAFLPFQPNTAHILSPSFHFFRRFHPISSSLNHFIIHLHTVSTSLFISFINHLPYTPLHYHHSHATKTSTTHSPSFHVLLYSYVSLLSLYLHPTIHLSLHPYFSCSFFLPLVYPWMTNTAFHSTVCCHAAYRYFHIHLIVVQVVTDRNF